MSSCKIIEIVILYAHFHRYKGGSGGKEPIMGQPLYKVNPWLMKNLEYEGLYDLIIPGHKLPECMQLPRTFNGAASDLFGSVVLAIVRMLMGVVSALVGFLSAQQTPTPPPPTPSHSQVTAPPMSAPIGGGGPGGATGGGGGGGGIKTPTLAERIESFNNEWRAKNSHCYYFGVYSFNFTRWKTMDASEMRTWCNHSTSGARRRYLSGYVLHSNLIMLVVEDEYELIHCGNLSALITNLYGGSKNTNDDLNLQQQQQLNGSNETLVAASDEGGEVEATRTPLPVSSSSSSTSSSKSIVDSRSKRNDDEVNVEDDDDGTEDDDIEYSLSTTTPLPVTHADTAKTTTMPTANNNGSMLNYDYETMMMLNDTSLSNSSSNGTRLRKMTMKDYVINRYRKKPDQCFNNFPDEKEYMPCLTASGVAVVNRPRAATLAFAHTTSLILLLLLLIHIILVL